MRFGPEDLTHLEDLFYKNSKGVVALREIWSGNRNKYVIGLRHDIDFQPALECALRLAAWEAERGYRATYYFLHTAEYWHQADFGDIVQGIALLGHEIGIHNDALGAAYSKKLDPHAIFADALTELRSHGVPVTSVVAHGNRKIATFARNDELFYGCERPNLGKPGRKLPNGMRVEQRDLKDYGLHFEAARTLGRGLELCDSGGAGWIDMDRIANRWPWRGQLHINQHPDWWIEAV